MVINKKVKPIRGFKGIEESKESTQYKPKSKRGNKGHTYENFVESVIPFLDEYIDDLKAEELVWYFRYVAEENGYRYIITSYSKDRAIMNNAKQNFSNREICGMIEFLYESNQTYLRKDTLSPNLLNSSWVNQIYADMKLWCEGKSINKKVDKKEWQTEKKGVKIGVKL